MKRNIFIVEDDRTTSQIIQSHLKSSGYNIFATAESGESALETLKSGSPDLILMDIGLEGRIDGIETAQTINDLYSIPVIFVTSSTDKETIERSKSVNPFGYIIKPIDRNELKTGIEMALLRFKMESAIKDSEYKLFTILNSIADAVVVTDSAGFISYANPVASHILQKDLGQLLNSKFSDIIKFNHDSASHEDLSADDIENHFLVLNDKTRIPVTYNISPLRDSCNNTSGAVVVIRDDTERMKSQQKLQDSIERLRKTMGGIVETMARTLEFRDPYTAGHQRRVSELAAVIAAKMRLSDDTIEGIRMSAIIHDIGKISIPAEILSKPGKLSEIEFSMMKTHSQTGFDILNNIEFPWPLAEMIYQHHEKLDGSGYPRGLKGEEIMLEARILTVADVVEAMASHRPYRPSLGIEMALEEIVKNKNVTFDPDIVDICVGLFRDEGYSMSL